MSRAYAATFSSAVLPTPPVREAISCVRRRAQVNHPDYPWDRPASDEAMAALLTQRWRELVEPISQPKGIFSFTLLGERMASAALRGYVFDMKTGQRSLSETRRFYEAAFEYEPRISAETMVLVDAMPTKLFEDLQAAALVYRMNSDLVEPAGRWGGTRLTYWARKASS